MNSEVEASNGKNNFSRRDFLRFGAWGIFGSVMTSYIPDVKMDVLEKQIVGGVEVYGLKEKILNEEHAKNLVFEFDTNFESKLSWAMKQKSVLEQRELLMPKDKRVVEFVVKESVYKSFEDRRGETGVSYVEWVKLHIDLLNRVLKNSKPLVCLMIELARIVVVGDDFEKNPIKYSKDIDAIWFNDEDYRIDQTAGNIGQDGFWDVIHDDKGDLIVRNPAGADFGRKIVLPKADDSLETVRDGVWIDYGLIHELSHLLLNVPDEYVFSFENVNSLFNNFRFNTGSFMEPTMSPYIAALAEKNANENIRGYYTDPRGIGRAPSMLSKFSFYGDTPNSVSFGARGAEVVGMAKSEYVFPDYYDRKDSLGKKVSCKKMVKIDKNNLNRNSVNLNKLDFETQKIGGEELFPVLFRLDCKHSGVNKEVYIPIGILNMSKYSGVTDAKYNIEFSDELPPEDMKSQALNLVDQSEIEDFLNKNQTYAKMKVDGTSTWCVWVFQY